MKFFVVVFVSILFYFGIAYWLTRKFDINRKNEKSGFESKWGFIIFLSLFVLGGIFVVKGIIGGFPVLIFILSAIEAIRGVEKYRIQRSSNLHLVHGVTSAYMVFIGISYYIFFTN
ncbi:hypothetical protein [Neobacillus terrae]|uniref:hypothetical protein n=1 Tax=Neobacillus terrae TaxID=3034837 RepID=UPI00140B39FA|nr:hypothetical protein [Neobacillus terrae]NHM31977.1 hypothetical protein [Neobacillus terrae]